MKRSNMIPAIPLLIVIAPIIPQAEPEYFRAKEIPALEVESLWINAPERSEYRLDLSSRPLHHAQSASGLGLASWWGTG